MIDNFKEIRLVFQLEFRELEWLIEEIKDFELEEFR